MKNWKTTLAGVLTLVLTAIGVATKPETVGSPEGQAALGAAIATAVGLILARDASQAKPTDPRA